MNGAEMGIQGGLRPSKHDAKHPDFERESKDVSVLKVPEVHVPT